MNKKTKYLLLGVLFDAIGMISFIIPGFGEFIDLLWAPLSAWLMTRMYKGKMGQAAGVVSFIEEIVPGLDVVPTFTIMWLYTFVLQGNKKKKMINID